MKTIVNKAKARSGFIIDMLFSLFIYFLTVYKKKGSEKDNKINIWTRDEIANKNEIINKK